MTLDDYLRTQNLTNAEFGRRIGVAGETIRRYRANTRWPDRDTLAAIMAATDGLVRPDHFVSEAAQ